MSAENTIDAIVLYFTQERLRNRLTQEQVSQMSGIPLRTYQRVEQGETKLTIEHVNKLRSVYSVSWLDVAYGQTERKHIDTSDIAAAVKHLPPKLRLAVYHFIKDITTELREEDDK